MEAFEQIYRKYNAALFNYVLKISKGDRYIAEEIVQIIFIKIWETRANIDPERSFYAYLATIAKNHLYNSYQRNLIEHIYVDHVQKQSVESDGEMELVIEQHSLESFMDKVIENLPPARKNIFILSRKKFKTNREIAAELGIAESTVETQLSLANKYMRKVFTMYIDKILLIVGYLIN